MKFPDLSSLTLSNPTRLRDLIRQIRSAKTAAEERAVVQKECAMIRDSFRDEDNTWRCRNVAKLLYVSLLGYPAHFGQFECLKLIASPRFTDKRIGYLGAMLLLNEEHEMHVLVTHSLKTDLNHANQYFAGLALCALGVICSAAMSRDLGSEVEKLMKSSNPYLKKKAILCAVRIIRKVPEQIDLFQNSIRNLLTEKNHGVLLATISLMDELCNQSPEALHDFRKFVPNLVRTLKTLIVTGYNPDHDVAGISDPFLQVRLLRILRTLGRNDDDASEYMNDILTQVATNTDGTKTVGNAILYEAVITIMNIKSESALRMLAVNNLARFLLNSDKNIRYVALNTLLQVVHIDHTAVQRHRVTIVECLKDPDISIKKRAMELSFALINANNIQSMTDEILQFLATCENEFKADCTSNIFLAMERYAPSKKWHVDQMIKVLQTAGNSVRDDIISNLIGMISTNSGLQVYATLQLYKIIQDDITQQPLVQVAIWSLGEFSDLLISQKDQYPRAEQIEEINILNVIERILNCSISTIITRQYAINALMKLSSRFPNCSDRIQSVMTYYACNMNLELQTRAVEYTTLFTKHNSIRPGIVERMPILVNATNSQETPSEFNGENEDRENQTNTETNAEPLINLLEMIDMNENPTSNELVDGNDLMKEFLSVPTQKSNSNIPSMKAFEKNGLQIIFNFERQNEILLIHLEAKNSTSSPMTNFVLRAAVPKTFSIELLPANGNVIAANNGGSVRQTLKIKNTNRDQLRIRVKITYSVENRPISEEADLNNFPQQCYE